jgi:hypothetical protein
MTSKRKAPCQGIRDLAEVSCISATRNDFAASITVASFTACDCFFKLQIQRLFLDHEIPGESTTSNMPDDLATDIRDTKKKIEKLEEDIENLRTGGDDLAKEHGYSTRITALESLRAEKLELDKRLTTYEKQKLAALTLQQQQSAGTSMLPVRQDLVRLPNFVLYAPANLVAVPSVSCRMQAQACTAAACCCCTVRCALER